MQPPAFPPPSPWSAPQQQAAGTPAAGTAQTVRPTLQRAAVPTAAASLSDVEWQVVRAQAAQWHAAQRSAMQWTAPPSTFIAPAAPSRSHRRRAGVVAAGSLVILAAAMTATVVLHDKPAEASYSLDQAALEANDASTIEYSFELKTAGATVTGDAQMDIDDELMTMTMQSDQVDGSFDYMFDLGANNLYVDSDLFADRGADVGDAQWVEFDLDDVYDFDMSSMLGEVGDNPLDATAMFDKADDVKDLGFDEVSGQRVKHYQITVDDDGASKSAAVASLNVHAMISEGTDQSADGTVFDAYVNQDNDLVRLSYGQKVMGEFASMDITVTSVGQDLDVTVPRRSTVVQFDDLDY